MNELSSPRPMTPMQKIEAAILCLRLDVEITKLELSVERAFDRAGYQVRP